jgi:hypothetical protein
MSDAFHNPPARPWAQAQPTPGPMFRCARCDKPRLPQGRRLQRVMGLRTWVCAGCAK